ncbi:hypothetical protein PENTCL1PPCAC_2023, partial [Pristionchus entomophagus]
ITSILIPSRHFDRINNFFFFLFAQDEDVTAIVDFRKECIRIITHIYDVQRCPSKESEKERGMNSLESSKRRIQLSVSRRKN